MSKSYNGWTNYETWNVKLWMDNDESSYRHNVAMAEAFLDAARADEIFTRQERAALDLAEALKEDYESDKDELLEKSGMQASVWADLLGAALSEVNWYEIATHMIDEAVDNVPAGRTFHD